MVEMKATAARTEFVSSPGIDSRPRVLALIFLAFVWFEVINQLRSEWSLNPQYGYGWSVPFLGAYLIWKRWRERPVPSPPQSATWPLLLVALAAFLFFPIRLVAEANPDWRLLSWSLSLLAVAISISFIFHAGGGSWVRHFAFPFFFFLVAVPWPTHVEQIVIQNLMRAVTAINVSLLNLAGVPALQHGNVIEVGTGLIGIEEACSGVRSLQATLMISLFLGDLYSFVISRRVLLVIAGALLAFFCNLIRTAVLVWLGANRGATAIEAWHDPAGLTILLACFFGLWLLSLLLRRHARTPIEPLPERKVPPALFPSRALLLSLIVWLAFAEVAVQVWYGLHRSSLTESHWTVRWPVSERDYKSVPIPPEAESILGYNEGGGATWNGSDVHQWMMYFFRWFPGRTAALFVKIHRPDVCLPASGLTLVREDGIRLLAIKGANLPVRSYRFEGRGVPLHVFYCYWDARSSYESVKAANEEDWTAIGRLRAAWRGRREIGAQMLEVVVWGYENDGEADAALRRQLGEIIQPG